MPRKSAFSLILLFILSFKLLAQAPDQFSFQGVARNAEGKVVGNTTIGIRITIHVETPVGEAVYQETHQPLTNAQGVFSLSIGRGTVQSGQFDQIMWQVFPHFLQLEMDPNAGTNYTDLGTTQMQSVPYALHAKDAHRWNNSYPVVQNFVLEPGIDLSNFDINDPRFKKYLLPTIGDGSKLIWYPLKGAFRAGNTSDGKWEDNLIGGTSFAAGNDTEASGSSSTALGQLTKASGNFSLATGFNTKASSTYSLSAGLNTEANAIASASFGHDSKTFGTASFAFGYSSIAKAAGSFVVGSYNNASDSPGQAFSNPTDRIFQIGNGYFDGTTTIRQNALTMLRNGYLGLGKNVLEPKYILDIEGRARVRHSSVTAGIHFDDTAGKEAGFVGMKTDDQVGLFINDWQFWVDKQGNGFLEGNVIQTSDARLKHNLKAITGSLVKVAGLNPYHYQWKDPSKDQALQTGLIAQDVEKIFPELVKTDAQGFKSVNYIGLIPHLIDSIKQLTRENESLQSSQSKILNRLDAIEARVRNDETSDQ